MSGTAQACPKCDPQLTSSAGLASIQQGIPLEPAFTRKKKVPEHSKKVSFLSTYPSISQSISASKDDKAELFKAGYRRANTSHPTSYQMGFSQPWAGKIREHRAPLIEAEQRLRQDQASMPARDIRSGKDRHSPECPLSKIQKMDRKPKYDVRHKLDDEFGREEPPVTRVATEHAPADQRGGVVVEKTAGPKCRRPLFVDRLPLPVSSDEKHDKASRGVKKKVTDGFVKTKPEGTESKKAHKHSQARTEDVRVEKSAQGQRSNLEHQTEGSRHFSRSSADGRRRRIIYKSPLKKLYEKDRAMQARAVGIFETEYQKHYRDWVGEIRKNKKHKQRSVTPPPVTYGGPPVLKDPSDPRLLKHSPPPPSLPSDQPLGGQWMTHYKLNFGGPESHKWASRSHQGDKENFNPSEDDSQVPPYSDAASVEDSSGRLHDPSGMSWFDQLIELRRKADQNKWQSERTNFQPHYLVQVRDHAPLTHGAGGRRKETSSSESSVSSQTGPDPERMVAADSVGGAKKQKSRTGNKYYKKDGSRPRERGELVIEDLEAEDEHEQVGRELRKPDGFDRRSKSDKVKGHRTQLTHPVGIEWTDGGDVECTCDLQHPHYSVEDDLDDYDGRIPTDELRKKGLNNYRHHLDRTTPLLVSPPKHTKESPLPSRNGTDDCTDSKVHVDRKCSNEVLGAGGRDIPRHISGRSSPFHADCIPEDDRYPLPNIRSRSRSPPPSKKTGQIDKRHSEDSKREKIAKKSGKRMWVTRPGTDSCNVCGSSLKPAAPRPQDQSRAEPLGSLTGSKPPPPPQKGKDYVVPVTVAAQPCGAYGRMCDKQPEHYSVHQSVRSSQQQSQKQLKKIRNNLKITEQPPVKHVTGQIYPGHSHKVKQYEPSSYRDYEADQLSLSPLSMSSCSVASDILEKARKRRDHFWVEQRQPSE